MISDLVGFLFIGIVVGLVTLSLSEPLERPLWREFVSFLGVVMGSIALFTVFVVVFAAALQY